MTPVLNWLKSNVASVIFFLVMIVAIVALPIVAGTLNENVRKTVKERVASHDELKKLEKTSITIPRVSGEPISQTSIINEKLLDRYRQVVEGERKDATRVREAALAHNSKSRRVLMPGIFPEPPPSEREVAPHRFHDQLIPAYRALQDDIQAGEPPSIDSMAEIIERKRARLYSQVLQKNLNDPLDAQEEMQLRDELAKERMNRYMQEADRLRFYVSPNALWLPAWEQSRQPTMADLYEWQWQYWIVEDVLRGLASANATTSVRREPVKQVIEIAIGDDASAAAASPGGGGGGAPGFGGGAPGFGGGGERDTADDTPAGPSGVPLNPASEAPLDFTQSFTGRTSNALYDVRLVRLRVVVETARINEVLDAIARRNFITIIDLAMTPADHYAASRSGYYYGQEPVSELSLLLETVWLREWMIPFMPPEVRQAKGIADPKQLPAG